MGGKAVAGSNEHVHAFCCLLHSIFHL